MKPIRTAGKTVLASSIFLGMAVGTAHAEICYQLKPFIDVIRLAETAYVDEAPATATVGGGTHTLLVGNWTALNFYSLPVVGSLDVSFNNPPGIPAGTLRVGLHGLNHTLAGANHSDCILDAIPSVANAAGFGCNCDGRAAAAPFLCPVFTLAPVSCDPLSTAAVAGKPILGTP